MSAVISTMTIHAQHAFGQAGGCAPAGPATVDKWKLLEALTHGAAAFGIGHRQIGVLRALISFHPQRYLPVTADSLIVYPSNRTLAERLGGMPDSTLRRHLAALIKAGLLTRRASSNGKRFRRGRGAHEVAFGLDLAPLIQASAAIQTAARTAQDAAERLAAARAELMALRQDLIATAQTTHSAFLTDLARVLRRRLTLSAITALIAQVRSALPAVTETKKMNATDSENERHIEQQDRTYLQAEETQLTPSGLTDLCPETRSFFPKPMQCWRDVEHTARSVAKLLGIDSDSFARVALRHGPLVTSIAVLYVLEHSTTVKCPAAYLCALGKHENLLSRLTQGLRSGQLSADNPQNHLIS